MQKLLLVTFYCCCFLFGFKLHSLTVPDFSNGDIGLQQSNSFKYMVRTQYRFITLDESSFVESSIFVSIDSFHPQCLYRYTKISLATRSSLSLFLHFVRISPAELKRRSIPALEGGQEKMDIMKEQNCLKESKFET